MSLAVERQQLGATIGSRTLVHGRLLARGPRYAVAGDLVSVGIFVTVVSVACAVLWRRAE